MKEIIYKWHCDKCGESASSESRKYINEFEKSHKCDPKLYNMVRSIKSEFTYNKKPMCCNGEVELVSEYFGISDSLANEIIHEMLDKGLAAHGHRE
jgi:hypothetical protein